MDTGAPDSIIERKAAPGAVRWSWPTTSARSDGRIRAANGAAALLRPARCSSKRSTWSLAPVMVRSHSVSRNVTQVVQPPASDSSSAQADLTSGRIPRPRSAS